MTPSTTFRGSLGEKRFIQVLRGAITTGRVNADGLDTLTAAILAERDSTMGKHLIKMGIMQKAVKLPPQTPLLDAMLPKTDKPSVKGPVHGRIGRAPLKPTKRKKK